MAFLEKKGFSIDGANNRNTCFPIHLAVMSDADKSLEWLLNRGADIEVRDKSDATPLHYAAESSSWKAASLLLERGASLNVRDTDGVFPVVRALRHGQREVAKKLFEASPSEEIKTAQREDASLFAARSGNIPLISQLDSAEMLCLRDLGEDKVTLMHAAVASNQKSMLEWLELKGLSAMDADCLRVTLRL